MKEQKRDILTVPNLLTLLRLMLIPVYATMYMKAQTSQDYIMAASVLAFSSLTDMIDGFIARRCNMVSRLGIMLDPFADKLTQGVLIICISIKHHEVIPLLVLFVIKEMFMLIMGCLHLRKKKMLDGALFAGKLCTTVLFLSMIAMVVFPSMHALVRIGIVVLCSIFMLISLYAYAKCYFTNSERITDMHKLTRE